MSLRFFSPWLYFELGFMAQDFMVQGYFIGLKFGFGRFEPRTIYHRLYRYEFDWTRVFSREELQDREVTGWWMR